MIDSHRSRLCALASLAASLVTLSSGAAMADTKLKIVGNSVQLAKGLVLQRTAVRRKGGGEPASVGLLQVVEQGRRATIVEDVYSFEGVTLGDNGRVVIEWATEESPSERLETTLSLLRARIESTAGAALAKKKDLVGAEQAFARAHALQDDTESAIALALVKADRQDLEGATAVLAPFAKRDPLRLYARLLGSRWLTPFLDAAPIVAMRSPTPGDARLALTKPRRGRPAPSGHFLDGDLAWSSHLQTIAVLQSVYGVDYEEGERSESQSFRLAFLEGKSGAVVFSLSASDTARFGDRLLTDLGFQAPAKIEYAVLKDDESRGISKGRFPGVQIGLVLGEKARLFRGDRQLAEQKLDLSNIRFLDSLVWAAYLPTERLVVYKWRMRPETGSCGSRDTPMETLFGLFHVDAADLK